MTDMRGLMWLAIAGLGAGTIGATLLPPPLRAAADHGLPNQDRDPYLAMNQALVANGCQLCHGADYARVGPPMVDVAEVHADDRAKAAVQLRESILNGSKGRWGPAIMPPQHQVTPEQADRLVATILAMKRKPEPGK